MNRSTKQQKIYWTCLQEFTTVAWKSENGDRTGTSHSRVFADFKKSYESLHDLVL